MSGPRSRADCALGNYVELGNTPGCFGDGALHNNRCPEARRLARSRARWAWVQTVVVVFAIGAMGAATMLSVWARTCGLGVRC